MARLPRGFRFPVQASTGRDGEAAPARQQRKNDHPERREQKRIVGFLTSLGGRVWEIGTTRRKGDYQGTMQTKGLPDLIAFLKVPGQQLARQQLVVEVKVDGNTMTPEQQVYRQSCLEAGVQHVVGGLDDVIAWLVSNGHVKAENLPHYRIPKELKK